MPVDAGLGPRLADLLDPAADGPRAGASGSDGSTRPSPSPRTVALARLVAAAIRAGDELAVPTPDGDRWRWRVAPGPRAAEALDSAIDLCLAAGSVVDPDPLGTLRTFVDEVVDARMGAAPPGSRTAQVWATSFASMPAGRRGAILWADHVIARGGANARLALVLSPPDPDAATPPAPARRRPAGSDSEDGPGFEDGRTSWTLAPMAIGLAESTTRLPLGSAAPALYGASEAAWQKWVATEALMLRRAWGARWTGSAGPLSPAGPVDAGAAAGDLVGELVRGRVVHLSAPDVLSFVDQVAPRIMAAGFDVVAPGGLLRPASVRRRLRPDASGTGALRLEGLGLAAEILVDGELLGAEEMAALAASKSELVSVRGRWLRIGPEDAHRLAGLARRLHRQVTPGDLLADEAFQGIDIAVDEVLPAGLNPAREVDEPPGVHATLRHYQRAGLDWLTWLADNGVGGVLADDMGLGKTLQVLVWICADHQGPTLVVCPVTLVDTWARQAAQFTPGLRVATYHGGARGSVAEALRDVDILVTTYGLLAREASLLEVPWHRVVLDEAQAIKNPDTQAARAARALTAAQRLVVTGTPVENHLGDLWSLLAFAHPGLLPRRKQFATRFGRGDPEDLARVRAVVGPFLLRRVKTDPGILPDLPDRQVIRVDCTLTREQVGAYEAIVSDMLGALEELRQAAARRLDPEASEMPGSGRASRGGPAGGVEAETMGRRAAVLGGISRLKQVCVHPALLTESRRSLGERSGKVTRLVELCGQIVDEDQAVVVFTQFASFVPDLAAHLSQALGVRVATLTGSDSRAARAATVAAFSAAAGPPILIASLKAGGTGLTLVRANHVIHLDRWWNPAVEDQASDRVWRIGQHQKVSVHVLVCPGTLEDRIDEALSAKRGLAASVVRPTESAITELTDADLSALVGLVRERVLG
ncbi:MAG: SNF2-related protein [Candidatus Nanopelagicales bacterium]